MSLKSVCRMNTQQERAGKVARVKEMAPFYPKVRPGIGHALSRTMYLEKVESLSGEGYPGTMGETEKQLWVGHAGMVVATPRSM